MYGPPDFIVLPEGASVLPGVWGKPVVGWAEFPVTLPLVGFSVGRYDAVLLWIVVILVVVTISGVGFVEGLLPGLPAVVFSIGGPNSKIKALLSSRLSIIQLITFIILLIIHFSKCFYNIPAQMPHVFLQRILNILLWQIAGVFLQWWDKSLHWTSKSNNNSW